MVAQFLNVYFIGFAGIVDGKEAEVLGLVVQLLATGHAARLRCLKTLDLLETVDQNLVCVLQQVLVIGLRVDSIDVRTDQHHRRTQLLERCLGRATIVLLCRVRVNRVQPKVDVMQGVLALR